MRRRDDGPEHRRSGAVSGPPVALLAAAVVAAVVGACSPGSRLRPDPPAPPISVLPAADRIRLGQTRLAGPGACLDDAYCAAGLSRVYGIDLGTRVVALGSPTATVEALDAGAVDVGALPSSAAASSDARVSVLTDDRGLAPASNVVPVVSGALVRAGGPALTASIDRVSAELFPAGLFVIERALADGASPELAAQGWLGSHVPSPPPPPPPSGAPKVLVGARADDESQALAQLYSGALAHAGWSTTVVPVGGGRPEELDALDGGRVGLVPEEISGLLDQLTAFTAMASSDLGRTLALLRPRLADRGLVALAPSVAAPGTVFAVSRPVASALGLTTLSDLARASGAHPPPIAPPSDDQPLGASADAEGPPPPLPPTLGIGTSGPTVASLQQRLADLGYGRIGVPGAFDELTRRAVVAFQIDQDLIADGEVDPATRRALASAHPTTHPAQAPSSGDPGSVRVPASLPGLPPNPGPVMTTTTTTPGAATGSSTSGVGRSGGSGADGETGTVYLAFGGGPSPVTPQVLDLLRRHRATATFFVDEEAVGRHPELVRQAVGDGNAVGTSAPPHDGLSPVAQDLLLRTAARTEDTLAAIVPRTPSCLLAPYGATDPGTRQRASQLGQKVVLWDLDPQDWRRPGSGAIARDVLDAVGSGSVVLLHDGGGDRSQTVTALGPILDSLAARGFTVAAIPDCA